MPPSSYTKPVEIYDGESFDLSFQDIVRHAPTIHETFSVYSKQLKWQVLALFASSLMAAKLNNNVFLKLLNFNTVERLGYPPQFKNISIL